jgi:hypothetical protein
MLIVKYGNKCTRKAEIKVQGYLVIGFVTCTKNQKHKQSEEYNLPHKNILSICNVTELDYTLLNASCDFS